MTSGQHFLADLFRCVSLFTLNMRTNGFASVTDQEGARAISFLEVGQLAVLADLSFCAEAGHDKCWTEAPATTKIDADVFQNLVRVNPRCPRCAFSLMSLRTLCTRNLGSWHWRCQSQRWASIALKLSYDASHTFLMCCTPLLYCFKSTSFAQQLCCCVLGVLQFWHAPD